MGFGASFAPRPLAATLTGLAWTNLPEFPQKRFLGERAFGHGQWGSALRTATQSPFGCLLLRSGPALDLHAPVSTASLALPSESSLIGVPRQLVAWGESSGFYPAQALGGVNGFALNVAPSGSAQGAPQPLLNELEMKMVRIGTRGSALALAQTDWLRRKLEERYPGVRIETVTIKTSGDRFLDTPIKAIGGKGIFVKEIEEALLRKEVDLAVHSMKDLPTEIPSGLTVAAIPEREDPRDVLVSLNHRPLRDLPSGARIGTGSLRRRAQILYHRPDLSLLPIRGNIDTRLKKLDRGEVDALIMAVAGLRRIGWESRVSEYLSPEICLSAVAQGALGLESRDGNPVIDEIAFLHHRPTAMEVLAERGFLRRLGGGCQIPVGARAWMDEERIRLKGVVADADGRKLFRGEISGASQEAEGLGQELAERLLEEGADEVLVSDRSAFEEKTLDHGSR